MSAASICESWSRVWRWLEPAMHEGWTEDEVLNELLCGRAQLWEGDAGAVVTRCFWPDHFHIWLAGGELRSVLSLLTGGIAWARPMGLKRLTAKGRPGWARVLRGAGFDTIALIDGQRVLERAI